MRHAAKVTLADPSLDAIPTEKHADRAHPASRHTGRPRASRCAQARHEDPPGCDPVIPAAELEFMQAMQQYKRTSGRMFPTWSEVLEVVRGLGYEKATA